jgi:hypothetical protein
MRIITFITLLFVPLYGNVQLSVTTARGSQSDEFPVNQPFSIVVTVNSSEQVSEPTIAGLGEFVVQGRTSSSRFVVRNGVMSAERSFIFNVRASKPGTFTLGPAQLTVGGKTEHSSRIKIKVIPAVATDDQGPAFLEVSADKTVAMLGQPITLHIKLYLRDGVQLINPLMLDFARYGWTVQSSEQVATTQKTIRAQVYTVHEQKLVLTSATTGKKTVPALMADCVMPSQQHSVMDMFGFLARHSEPYHAQSAPLDITVTELPPHTGPVHGIGSFSKLRAKINTATAKVGEGLVYTLELTGTSAQHNSAPQLELPADLTAYESNHQATKFEYVVQAVNPGKYRIPPQTFTFFDMDKGVYQTLTSNPIPLTVTGERIAPATPPAAEVVVTSTVPTALQAPVVRPNYLRLLLIVLLCLVVGILGWLFGRWLKNRYRATQTVMATAFKRARTQLHYLQKTNNQAGLYQLMITLFAQRMEMPVGDITEFSIRQQLVAVGMPAEKIDAYLLFIGVITEMAFAQRSTDHELFAQADQWLKELRRWL